jgi:hypothetical protein
MRKILLASTALVAMSVTAAQADISISGSVQFEVADDGTTTSYVDDSNLMITGGRAMDNGINATVAMNITGGNAASAAQHTAGTGGGENTEDVYIDLSGDFGSVRMGDTDDALDRMDGVNPANWDNEGIAQGSTANGRQVTAMAIGGDRDGHISFISPSISGATVYGATNAEGANTGMGVNYTAGPVTVMAQSGQNGTTEANLMAAEMTVAGIRVGFSSGTTQATRASAKVKFRAMGAAYTMGAATLTAVTQKRVGGETYSSVGVAYTVAPGMSVVLESGSQETESGTYAHLNVTF